MTDQTILQNLYDSEINFTISCFFDGGFSRSTFAQKYAAGAAATEVGSPPLVPEGFNTDVYVVLDDFGSIGRSYRETDEERADRETLIRDFIAGQYEHPVRIIAFNTAQGWARDVSEEIACEIRDRASRTGADLAGPMQAFVEYEMDRAERRQRAVAAHLNDAGGPPASRAPHR
jgi:hypothetical protein